MHRPHTCPALTPQFHWNLNAHAVETLSETDLAQAYQLFRFYDSSSVGDALPSINCRRLLQLLQDSGLVVDSETVDDTQDGVATTRIAASAVETLFVEAVLGKLRTYLDADDQPVLTFPLFCGVLLNCATTVFPGLRAEPEAALRTLLSRLLTSADKYADKRRTEHPRDASKKQLQRTRDDLERHASLLRHFPDDGRLALWRPGEALGVLAPMPSSDDSHGGDSTADFRRLEPFQQVLATFSLDVVREARARERSQLQYTVPPELAAHFSSEHLSVVVERFRLFDVFDRGSLPRQEVLPLLTGLVKKLEIPDMYAVLAQLLTSDRTAPRDYSTVLLPPVEPSMTRKASVSSATTAPEITLRDVLSAIATCRRSRTAAAGQSGPSSRRTGGVGHGTSASVVDSAHPEVDGGTESTLSSAASDRSSGAGDSNRPGRKASKATTGKGSVVSRTEGGKGPVASGDMYHRRQSTMLLKDDALAARAAAASMRRKISRKMSRLGDAALTCVEDGSEPESIETAVNTQRIDSRPEAARRTTRAAESVLLDSTGDANDDGGRMNRPEISSAASPTTATASFRVFMLLGGEHDGAVCYSIELTLPQRRLEEASGVFYLNAPSDTLTRTLVLPVQPDAESALLLLRKRVSQRQREGFALHPHELLERVDAALARVRSRSPHYASALHTTGIRPGERRQQTAGAHRATTQSTHAFGSLDRGATHVRQRSTSNLRTTLSDPHLNLVLRDRRRAAMCSDDADEHESSQRNGSAPLDADTSSVAWIHALNDAMHKRAQLQPIQEPQRGQR